MEIRKRFPSITEHSTWGRWQQLVGFSSQQIADLKRMKELYQQGVYHETTPEQRRLEFVRWLYQHNRLQS